MINCNGFNGKPRAKKNFFEKSLRIFVLIVTARYSIFRQVLTE